jgi:hypothetical protein
MQYLLRWVELHPGAASWVQAIGSIVALGIAIIVPAYQTSLTKRQVRRDAALQFKATIQIVQQAVYLVFQTKNIIEDPASTKSVITDAYRLERFAQVAQALDGVEIHQLPSPEAVARFMDATHHFNDSRKWIDAAFKERMTNQAISKTVGDKLVESADWLSANHSWLRNESKDLEKGRRPVGMLTATIAGKKIGKGRTR